MGVASFGIEIGLIKPNEIENLDTFDSISEMLNAHRVRNDRIDLLDKGFGIERD